MKTFIAGDKPRRIMRVLLHMLPDSTASHSAFVVASWVWISFHQLLAVLAPPKQRTFSRKGSHIATVASENSHQIRQAVYRKKLLVKGRAHDSMLKCKEGRSN